MLTERSRWIFGIRQKFSEKCFIVPYKWNLKTQHLSLTSGLRYFCWPIVHTYLMLYDFGSFLILLIYLSTWKNIEKFDRVTFIADLFFVNLLTLINAAHIHVFRYRLEGAQLTNQMSRLDEQLESKF